jgi:hypothetical protein
VAKGVAWEHPGQTPQGKRSGAILGHDALRTYPKPIPPMSSLYGAGKALPVGIKGHPRWYWTRVYPISPRDHDKF